MKTVKFTTSGSSSVLGNFEAGDLARNIPDDMAAHFVNDARCAQYVEPVLTLTSDQPTKETARRQRKPTITAE